jgi:rhodanese-related sulfurtransferase
MVDDGAVWVDVRTEDEYEHDAFEDSVNIPLSCLRDELSELVFNSKYIICCDTGRRSESAGFLLSHKGFDVYVLEGGIPGLSNNTVEMLAQGEAASAPDDGAEVIDFEEGKCLSDRQSGADNSDVASTQVDSETTGGTTAHQGANEDESALVALRNENDSLTEQLQSVRSSEERMSEQLEQLRGELGESGEKLATFYEKEGEEASEKQLLQEQLSSASDVPVCCRRSKRSSWKICGPTNRQQKKPCSDNSLIGTPSELPYRRRLRAISRSSPVSERNCRLLIRKPVKTSRPLRKN